MLHALASAPLDDEPSTAEEDASAAEALAAYGRGESVSSDELRAEFACKATSPVPKPVSDLSDNVAP